MTEVRTNKAGVPPPPPQPASFRRRHRHPATHEATAADDYTVTLKNGDAVVQSATFKVVAATT